MKKYYLIQDANGKFLQEGKWGGGNDRMWSQELICSRRFETFEEAESLLNTKSSEEEWTANNIFQDSEFYTIQTFYFRK